MRKVLATVLSMLMLLTLFTGVAASADYAETVYFGYASDTATAEPLQDSSTQLNLVTNMTFRSLTRYDQKTGVLNPVLATEWEPNEDSTVWTFKLREGVKFHDGSTLDAEDVVFTFNRAVDGTQVKVPASTVAACLDSVKAVDDLTVEFTLVRPVYDFPYLIDMTNIWSKEAFDSGMENPGYIGCGPYKWAGQEIGVSYTLEAFEDYFEGCPKTPKIVFKVMPEIDSQIAALQTGEINFMTAVRATDLPIFDADPNIDYITHGGATVYFLVWNSRREIANDKRVTDAIAMAYDKESANIAKFSGLGELTDSMVGNSASPDFVEIENPVPFDPEAAKALLAEAGYGEGDLTLTCQYYAWCKPFAEIFQACCSDIGVNVEMKEIDGSVFRALCEEGDYDVTMTYCGLGVSTLYMLERFFKEDGAGNWFGYVPTDEILAQFEVCYAQRNIEDLMKESAVLQQLCAADTRYIPVCMAPVMYGWTSNLQGYVDPLTSARLDFSSAYIEK